MNLSQYIYSSIDGHWGGFLLLTIMDSPAVNIHRYVFGNLYTLLFWVVFEMFCTY